MMELTYGLWSPPDSTFCHDDCKQISDDTQLHLDTLGIYFSIYNTVSAARADTVLDRNSWRGVAYPGVRDNRSTLNTKTGYDDDEYLLQEQNNHR